MHLLLRLASHPVSNAAQSTYCQAIQEHCATKGRSVRVANLDPAAETFKYEVAFGAFTGRLFLRSVAGGFYALYCCCIKLLSFVCGDADIRDLISVDDVMSEMQMGPNGALMFCMEYLVDNVEWLQVRQWMASYRHAVLS